MMVGPETMSELHFATETIQGNLREFDRYLSHLATVNVIWKRGIIEKIKNNDPAIAWLSDPEQWWK